MNKRPSYEELARRVEELEKRVQQLEAQPREQHFHYHPPVYQQPYIPYVSPAAPAPNPVYPYIGDPIPQWGTTTTVPWMSMADGTVTINSGSH